MNSKTDEENIIIHLQNKFGDNRILKSPERRFGDMIVDGHVVNIKTSKLKSCDNAYSPGGFLWAFTDMGFDEIPASVSPKKFNTFIVGRKADIDRDYWFLVVDKNSPNRVIVRGLKQLQYVRSNPRNFFQISWKDEFLVGDVPTNVSTNAARRKILGTLAESYRKIQRTTTDTLNALVQLI